MRRAKKMYPTDSVKRRADVKYLDARCDCRQRNDITDDHHISPCSV